MNQRLISMLTVIVTSFVSVSSSFGQKNSLKLTNGEIGINVFQFSDLARYHLYSSIDGGFTTKWGIVYKAQVIPNIKLRTSAIHFYEYNHFLSGEHIYDAAWDYEAEERRFDLTFGLERKMSKGRISSYIFGDIYQQLGQRKKFGRIVSFGGPSTIDETYNFNQLGIASGVGIKLRVNQHLHLNLESHTRFVREFNSSKFYTFRREKYQAYFNPVSRFSVNYRL